MKKALSIIVPVYNTETAVLKKSLDSLVKQTSDDYQIILVDDGSTGGCASCCNDYAERYNHVTCYHQKNQGVSLARNFGMKQSDSLWVLFVDPDDWVEPVLVEHLIALAKSPTLDADVIFFNYWDEYSKQSRLQSFAFSSKKLKHEEVEACYISLFYKLMQGNKFNSYSISVVWNKLYRTEFLLKHDLFFLPGMKLGEDRLFNANVLKHTEKVFYLHQPLYHYRYDSQSVTNRYNKNILKDILKELTELAKLKENTTEILELDSFFNTRVCTRLYSYLRLFLFHTSNKAHYHDKVSLLQQVVSKEPFYEALKSVDISLLTLQEKVFVVALNSKNYWLVYLLVYGKSSLFFSRLK